MRPLTLRQADVLSVVAATGVPQTASGVGEYHLPIGTSSARAALAALERRGYVQAIYTGHGRRGRAFSITQRGQEALDALDGDRDVTPPPTIQENLR